MSNTNKSSSKDGAHSSGKNTSNSTQQTTTQFSKYLEGVVFVLSGFVNPERSTLRSKALEMGAVYKPDWTSDCTLLICAFPNTPKFRQVEADNGTIVSKEWISHCYNQKKLVEIDQYLMHAGNPWRKNNQQKANQDHEDVPPQKSQYQIERAQSMKIARCEISKNLVRSSNAFSPSRVKEWAINDLKKTVSWLESQEEKPEPDEIKKIAAEGILTCLQDAMEALRQNQDIRNAIEQWMLIPHVVKELAELDDGKKPSFTKKELSELALTCSKIYATELKSSDESLTQKRLKRSVDNENTKTMQFMKDESGFDSDATIEMTEEEINLACQGVGVH